MGLRIKILECLGNDREEAKVLFLNKLKLTSLKFAERPTSFYYQELHFDEVLGTVLLNKLYTNHTINFMNFLFKCF